MTKPKAIYFYEYKARIKHEVGPQCMIEVIRRDSEGTRYRCRAKDHDLYGHDNLKSAKFFEIQDTRERIYNEREWLKKLGAEEAE